MWEAAGNDENRRLLHSLALQKYELSADRPKREGQFVDIYRKLKAKRRRPAVNFDKKIGLLGFRDLRAEPIGRSGFYRYLQDGNLDYFSRDTYQQTAGDVEIDLSEKNVIDSLNTADAENILLISGRGGVGKTRLASHICHASDAELILTPVGENQNYLSLVEQLSTEADHPKHIIFFKDYAETVGHSGALDFFRRTVNEDLGIRTSVVLCSRTTGVRKAINAFPAIDAHFQIGENAKRNSLSYENWLVKQILSFFGLNGRNIIEAICKDRPMLAAFAGYLSVDHPDAFARQFSIGGSDKIRGDGAEYTPPLLADQHFRIWMERRINVFTEKLGSVGKRRAAEVALALPFQGAADQDNILDEDTGIRRQAFEILDEDGWIDQSGERFVSISHDVLADSLVNEHLFGNPKKATQRGRELLSTAIKHDYLGRALSSLDRIISDQDLRSIDAITLMDALDRDDRSNGRLALQMNSLAFLRSRIIPSSQVPELMERISTFADGLDDDPNAYAELSRIAPSLRRQGSGTLNSTRHLRFFTLLEKASHTADARTISNLVVFDPESHSRRAVLYIKRHRLKYETGFVMQAYLNAGLDPSRVGPYIVAWLNKFGKHKGASFVLSAWFRQISCLVEKGEVWNHALKLKEVTLGYLDSWCRRHRSEQNASWALQALIEHGGLESCSDLVEYWLGKHGKTPLAGYVIQKVLKSKDTNPFLSAKWANAWLESPAIQSNAVPAVHVIRELKNCVKGRRIIKFSDISAAVARCFEVDWPLRSRRDACVYWLEMGGDAKIVKDIIQKAVQQDYTDPSTRFAFEAWFEANTDNPLLLKQEMSLWLEANAALSEASYVFGFWDRLGLDIDEVKGPLRVWLRKNHENSYYSLFLGKLLKASPDDAVAIGISKERAPAFLKKEEFAVQDCRIIEFVLMSPFGQKGSGEIYDQALSSADRFLRQHIGEVGSAFLISLVLRVVGNEMWIRSYADDWLAIYSQRHRASVVYQALLFVEREPERLFDRIQDWFIENPTYELAGSLLMAWIEAECDPEILRPAAKIWCDASAQREEYPDVKAVEKWYEL